MKLIASLFIVFLVLTSCARQISSTIGQDFNISKTSQFIVGKTTISEAEAIMGSPPIQTIKNKEGRTALVWKYISVEVNSNISGGTSSTTSKSVTLVFDEQNKFLRVQNEVNQQGNGQSLKK